MSTFRIERIDQGQADEWIPRINDDGAQIGDDVVAEDVNELSEGIQATQEVILKSSIFTPGSLLDPNEGIASRLKTLEQTAGQASLQDVYENGNIISVQPGSPLLLGGNGEITLDDIGNLSFQANTMRVRGLGASYLGFESEAITSYLSNLNIGANSSGFNLTLTSGQDITFRDSNLVSPIGISEFGQTTLATTSQTLVGAINELKNGTFNTTLQSVYNQSSSGRIVTSSSVGPFRVENGTGNSLLAAINCVGKLIVTEAAELDTLQVGTDTTISDANGIQTTHEVRTSDRVTSPRFENAGSMTFQDNRIAVTLSELGVTGFDTSSQSIGGAINELKAAVDSIGSGVLLFGNQHSTSNGMHEIITTQASIGQDSTKRFIVYNSSGTERFSVNGLGEMIAQKLNLAGVAIEDAITNLLDHMNGDGLDHSGVLAHINAGNPHNTVKSINGLNNLVNITPGVGISVTQSGSNIVISSSITGIDLQAVYDGSSVGEIVLDTAGSKDLIYRNSSNDVLVRFAETGLTTRRDLLFDGTSLKISSSTDLRIQADTGLVIETLNGDLNIDAQGAANNVNIQGIQFASSASNALDSLLPSNVIGAINKIQNDSVVEITNTFSYQLEIGMPVMFASIDRALTTSVLIRPLADYHPMNDWFNYFGQSLHSNVFVALEQIAPGDTGKFGKYGAVAAEVVPPGAAFETEWIGGKLYLAPQAFGEVIINDVTQIANGDTFTLDVGGANKVYTASTTISDHANGIFRVFSSGNANVDTQETINEIGDVINHQAYTNGTGTAANVIATFDGACARGKVIISDNSLISAGDLLQIDAEGGRYQDVILTAVAQGNPLNENEFYVGDTGYETAQYLAEAITRTQKRFSATATVQADFYSGENTVSTDSLTAYIDGHGFRAKAVGTTVYLEREYPDFGGNVVVLNSSTAGITTNNPSGGFIKVKYHCQDRTNNVMVATQSNAAGLTATDATYLDIHEQEYISEVDYQEEVDRLYKHKKPKKIGEVLDANATTALIFLDMD